MDKKGLKVFLLMFLAIAAVPLAGVARNPIIPDAGANDPHIRILNGRAYLSASHDLAIDSKQFKMSDWWLWSSDDLVNWELEYTLTPEETYLKKPFDDCWATDIVTRNGKYYWYFSERNRRSGVMVGDSPRGPWRDPLGKPLLDKDLTPTHEYDMGILEDPSGEFYIVFGVWDYYIAKLNEDMISLAETPRKLEIHNPLGPYNQDGTNKKKPTDDKPFLHYYAGKYYLSWGCFYAIADNPYGPYDCKGSFLEASSFAEGYDAPTWPNGFKQGRHGSFFSWHNQWYFAYCDISQTGNRYFRDTFISYIHYKANGEIALIRVDGVGVGEYDGTGLVQAEEFFKCAGGKKVHLGEEQFAVQNEGPSMTLEFPLVKGVLGKTELVFNGVAGGKAQIEVWQAGDTGRLLGSCLLDGTEAFSARCTLNELPDPFEMQVIITTEAGAKVQLDSFRFQ